MAPDHCTWITSHSCRQCHGNLVCHDLHMQTKNGQVRLPDSRSFTSTTYSENSAALPKPIFLKSKRSVRQYIRSRRLWQKFMGRSSYPRYNPSNVSCNARKPLLNLCLRCLIRFWRQFPDAKAPSTRTCEVKTLSIVNVLSTATLGTRLTGELIAIKMPASNRL